MTNWVLTLAYATDRTKDDLDIIIISADTEFDVIKEAEAQIRSLQDEYDERTIHLQPYRGHYKDDCGNRVYIQKVEN